MVLMYHHVSPTPGAFTVSPDHFTDQMRWLSESGYRVLDGLELERVWAGKMELEKPAVALTFDDGWLDNWVYALPVLRQFDIPATWFIVTEWPAEGEKRYGLLEEQWSAPDHETAMAATKVSDKRDSAVMRWSELKAANATGLVRLGSHSHTHGVWWQEESWGQMKDLLRRDLRESVSILEQRTGQRPTQLCWPKGQFTRSLVEIAAREGFELQHSVMRGSNYSQSGGLIRRLNVEDCGSQWLRKRLRFYRVPFIGQCTGLLHGWVQGRRMQRAYGERIPAQEFHSLGRCKAFAKS